MPLQFQNDWAIITLPTRLAQGDRGDLASLIRQARQKGCIKILLDASQLEIIDSYGVGFLAREMLKLREQNGEMAIQNLHGETLLLFQRMELVDRFHMHECEIGQYRLLKVPDLASEKARLYLEKHDEKGVTIVELKGEFTYPYGVKTFRDIILPLTADRNRFLLDFYEVDFLDSNALREVVNLKKMLETSKGRLSICRVSQDVRDLLRTLSFDRVMEVYTDMDAALESMQ